MNKIKSDIIKIIEDISDEEATSFEEIIEAIYVRYYALEGIKDIEAGNIMTIDQLRKEVATWK